LTTFELQKSPSATEVDMPETTNKLALVTVMLSPEELAALSAAAKRAELPLMRLAHIFITYGLAQLETADAGLERAIKGSRDAGMR
jgi:hypothetical protein